MAQEWLSLRKIREIFRLEFETGFSDRQIGQAVMGTFDGAGVPEPGTGRQGELAAASGTGQSRPSGQLAIQRVLQAIPALVVHARVIPDSLELCENQALSPIHRERVGSLMTEWRREWDSNPRYAFCAYTPLAGARLRPARPSLQKKPTGMAGHDTGPRRTGQKSVILRDFRLPVPGVLRLPARA